MRRKRREHPRAAGYETGEEKGLSAGSLRVQCGAATEGTRADGREAARRPEMTVAGTGVVATEMVEVVGVWLYAEGGTSEVSGWFARGMGGEEESGDTGLGTEHLRRRGRSARR